MKSLFRLYAAFLLSIGLIGPADSPQAAEPPHTPLVFVVATESQAHESGSPNGRFVIIRTGPVDHPLTVHYEMTGSADNGQDYAALSGQATISSGYSHTVVEVQAIDDLLNEGNEIARMNLILPPDLLDWPGLYQICWPYQAVVTVVDNDIAVNHPPFVRMVNPFDGAEFSGPTDIKLAAHAWDVDGNIVRVEFFANGNLVGSVGPGPNYSGTALSLESSLAGAHLEGAENVSVGLDISNQLFPSWSPLDEHPEILPHRIYLLGWEDVLPGDYKLTAVATDDDGATTQSDPVHITVAPPPPQPVVEVIACPSRGSTRQ